MLCTVVTRQGRVGGGGRRELEGKRGSVGKTDRVPEQSASLSLTHTHLHTPSHTFMSAPTVLLCGIVDYFLYRSTHQVNPGAIRSVTIHSLVEKDFVPVSSRL